jgi:integrase
MEKLQVQTLADLGGVPRALPLSKEAYAILWSRRGHHSNFVFTFVAKRTKRDPKTGTEFVRGRRFPITYYGFGSHWRYATARAGVKARIHDLRHTTGTRTLRTTGNLKLVRPRTSRSLPSSTPTC